MISFADNLALMVVPKHPKDIELYGSETIQTILGERKDEGGLYYQSHQKQYYRSLG